MEEQSDIPPNEAISSGALKCIRGVDDHDDGGVDRISQLPDDIIIVILSFLSLREAAATSVLSPRWSELWKHTPSLNFDMHILRDYNSKDDHDDGSLLDARRCKFIEIVNLVMQLHKALSLKKFSIFYLFKNSNKGTVTKWLEFVFSRQVESLDLNLRCEEGDNFVLGELLRESRICLQPQTDLIFFQSLKRLCLTSLTASGEDIELLLHKCPLLDQLTIKFVNLTSDVEFCGANLALKRLIIPSIRCNALRTIKVSAPNLTYIRFTAYDGVKPLFENAPKLVEAYFDNYTSEMVVQHLGSSASCNFPQLQILGLKLRTSKLLQVLWVNGFQMPNMKVLDINCRETYNHSLLQVTTALIWAFPRLEEFTLKYSDSFKELAACTQVITSGGRSPHQHLRRFELQMSPRQNVNDHIAELVMYLLNNCVALRDIFINRPSSLVDPATMDLITQRLQGKVPNHVQLELFKHMM